MPQTRPALTCELTSPLDTAWHDQHVLLVVPGLLVGEPRCLRVDGCATPFQYTGVEREVGAEVLLRLGFTRGQRRTLVFEPADRCDTDLTPCDIPCTHQTTVGPEGNTLTLDLMPRSDGTIGGPLGAYQGIPLASTITVNAPLTQVTLTRVNTGPLFEEYGLTYTFAEAKRYGVTYRCYRTERYIEVAEAFLLGMGAQLTAQWNPEQSFTHLVTHYAFDFERDDAPIVEALGASRPKDLLCRLQMPVIGEYVIPNNKHWCAFFHAERREQGMLGLLGLYGDRWRAPVENMLRFHYRQGVVTMTGALEAGERHWLLVASPTATEIPATRHYLFNRLHAEFTALRLDAHLDLDGRQRYDADSWQQPGILGDTWQDMVRRNTTTLPQFQQAPARTATLLAALGVPVDEQTPEGARQALRDGLFAQFARWVRQFQGYRDGQFDYLKNVIGFSRTLRMLLVQYELLRKTGSLTDTEVQQLGAYFAFAARRILDEGRWPHSKTALHPHHPESVRGLYAYPGEQVPDRLYWTNSLPNFQSDQLCALMHLACLFPDHPDARQWLNRGLDDLERQLDAYCGESGAWEESINYALFTFSYFVLTFRMLKHRMGIDYFQDVRVRAFAGWLTRYVAPYDQRFDSVTWPGVGNSVLPQREAFSLLAYANELDADDPLRAACLAVWQQMMPPLRDEYEVVFFALLAPPVEGAYSLPALRSEYMDELGVAMRHAHPQPTQSYLFQKIGCWKDHYENDETAFNWYAKGTPFIMDYGTYSEVGPDAHNLVEIPDMDFITRGYLAAHYLTEAVDYTHCETPVSLKLMHGRVRSFAEIDGPPQRPLYHYIGDDNPLGPKVWKTRRLLFVKPDYLLIFDRVFGAVPHRYNLHVVADNLAREGQTITARGRFDLDLTCFVQEPRAFRWDTGMLAPRPDLYGADDNPHRQSFFRLYHETGDTYRTVLFARERDRDVEITALGACGVKVVTPEYTDYAFINDEPVCEDTAEVRFTGRVGWIRRSVDGTVQAVMPDGDEFEAFGVRLTGRGPWQYNLQGDGRVVTQGVPRRVTIESLASESPECRHQHR